MARSEMAPKLDHTFLQDWISLTACLCGLLFANVARAAGLTIERNGAEIRIGNTNCVPDNGNSYVGSAALAIASAELSAGAPIKLLSLDFGRIADSGSDTYARKIELNVGDETFLSDMASISANELVSGASRIVYSFASTQCMISVGEKYSIKFLDSDGNEMPKVRYKVGKDADSFISNVSFKVNGSVYCPLVQLVGYDANLLAEAESHVSSTYADGEWIYPHDLGVAGSNAYGMVICRSPVQHKIGTYRPPYVSASVLARLPSGVQGNMFHIKVENSADSHTVQVQSKGDGTFLLTYDGTGNTVSPKEYGRAALDETHVFTFTYSSTMGATLFQDGDKLAEDTGIKWTRNGTLNVAGSVSIGADADGVSPLQGLVLYAIDIYYDGRNADYAYRVFDVFDDVFRFADNGARTLGEKLKLFDVYDACGIVGRAILNGEEQDLEKTVSIVRLFGEDAMSGRGVVFRIGGINMSDGEMSLDVSPPVIAGNSLSVFAKTALGDRWRRVKVNPTGNAVSIAAGEFADFRFFQLRAEEGEMSEGYPVAESKAVGDSAGTDCKSSLTSSATGGDMTLLKIGLSGGESGDYAADAYGGIAFELFGVSRGVGATLATNGIAIAHAVVDDDGRVSFGALPRFADGTTLSLGVAVTNSAGMITTAGAGERAGVVAYSWKDGTTVNIDGGVTNVITLLANTPKMDGLGTNEKGRYRIPAVAKAANGLVVALYDCRYDNINDMPNTRIDPAGSFSFDGGNTWTSPAIQIDAQAGTSLGEMSNSMTDPCILYDKTGDRFWVMGITGCGLSKTAASSDVVLYTRGTGADDVWEPWTGGPEGNGRSVQQIALDSLTNVDETAMADASCIKGILQGPGHGFAQRNDGTDATGAVIVPKGSLVFPMQYFPDGTVTRTQNFALYSTDGGLSWRATKLTPKTTQEGRNCYAQEGCVVELDDGTWEYMAKYGEYDPNFDTAYEGDGSDDARKDSRLFFRTMDFKTWVFDGYHPSKSIRSQGSCLWLGDEIKKAHGGASRYASCFSTWGNYPAERRGGLKLFFGRDTSSEDGEPGITWDCGEIEIRHEHTSACSYNSMVMLDDWTLGVVFESHGHIYLRKVDLRTILH